MRRLDCRLKESIFLITNAWKHGRPAVGSLVCCALLATSSCQHPDRADAAMSATDDASEEWVTYEGKVPLDEESNLYLELSLRLSGETGEGLFKLREFLEDENGRDAISSFKGRYFTLVGETPEERILQLGNTSHDEPLTRRYTIRRSRGTGSRTIMIREEPFRQSDLVLKIQGREKLLVLDKQLAPVSTDRDHNLVRRTSGIFTLEGYFRHNGDSADFYEINTGEVWAVTKLGDYYKAIRQYHQLTERKFEVTYMKAIGFSINHVNKQGVRTEALVIRKVLQMTSTTHEFPPRRSPGQTHL